MAMANRSRGRTYEKESWLIGEKLVLLNRLTHPPHLLEENSNRRLFPAAATTVFVPFGRREAKVDPLRVGKVGALVLAQNRVQTCKQQKRFCFRQCEFITSLVSMLCLLWNR